MRLDTLPECTRVLDLRIACSLSDRRARVVAQRPAQVELDLRARSPAARTEKLLFTNQVNISEHESHI